VKNLVFFNVEKKVESISVVDLLCIYVPDSYLSKKTEFYNALTYALGECSSLPDGIIILYSQTKSEFIESVWSDEIEKDNFYNRLQTHSHRYTKNLYFVSLSKDGMHLNKSISEISDMYEVTQRDLETFYREGISILALKNEVLNFAPSGHSFRHPSGNINKLFIQAKEMACNESELKFMAIGIVLLNPEFAWNSVKEVYIDSMGIYSLVKEALIFANTDSRIKNFHSYSGMHELTKPASEYLVIISASTSGKMAAGLISKGFNSKKILTLIDVEERRDISHVLVNINEMSAGFVKKEGVFNHETEIELIGEQFTYKAKPPKQVIIGINHEPRDLSAILSIFGEKGINDLNENLYPLQKRALISLKPDPLLENKDFEKWLEMEVKWNISSAINTIVFKKDGASEKLAEKTSAIIDKLRLSTGRVDIIEYEELTRDRLSNCTGILIVCAFSGDGGQLRQISRDLREFESEIIPRHFIIGVGIPQSKVTWDNLQKFLVRNATNRQYGFSAWKLLPLGPDVISQSWELLAKYASKLEVSEVIHNAFKPEEIDKCCIDLAKKIGSCAKSLLPNIYDETLKLTSGFVFFGNKFESTISSLNQSVIMLTISSVLQFAREHKNSDICLNSNNYQSVVLSPENFLRYNDDILQACLLRASLPSEIDYSSNYDLSVLMQEFLFKIFTRSKYSYGFSALEFAAALAIGKLKLKREHTIELIDKVIDFSEGELNIVIIFLLLLRSELTN